MNRDVERWKSEGNRISTIRRTQAGIEEVSGRIQRMIDEHNYRVQSLSAEELVAAPGAIPLSAQPPPPRLNTTTRINLSTSPIAGSESNNESKMATSPTNMNLSLPNSMKEALAHRNVDALTIFLEKRFSQVANGDYAWIAELKEVGYAYAEIAQLLYERTHDSPWIYFEPTDIPFAEILPTHHLAGCAHCFSSASPRNDLVSWQTLKLNTEREVIQKIEKLCGLGGVCPSSRDTEHWNGTAEFKEQYLTVLLRHRVLQSRSPTVLDTLELLIRVTENFVTAIRVVQDAGFCCDSFTVLRVCATTSHNNCPELRLSRITFDLAMEMTRYLRRLYLPANDPRRKQAINSLQIVSRDIISHAIGDLNVRDTDDIEDIFHIASLAIQFLCIGFLSYAQAHIGMLQPFFLDTPLRQIVLLGTELSSTPNMYITASLVKLTCLAGMCQGPVLAFHGPGPLEGTPEIPLVGKYDVRAFPRDVLDTWGPGELVSGLNNMELPLAMKIGGGYISPPARADGTGKYHWDHSIKLSASSPALNLDAEIVIGGLVTVNTICRNDEQICWIASLGKFEELGTYRSYSESIEYQFGLQGGPEHLAIFANNVWAKQRGKTVKAKNLEREDNMLVPFLDYYWGVRVSFCTGVAQRVLLRHLVADLLPAFAKTLVSMKDSNLWADLGSNHRIIERFRGTNATQQSLQAWLSSLPEDLNKFILNLIRQILETLKDTGLSPCGTHFVVAWPQDGVVNRCFRIPLDEHNKWTPMLADSDDCATFAYMSNVCLEAGEITCRGPNPTWQGRICLLETAVLCPASTEPWNLRHEQTYFFHKLDNNLFWVRAQRDMARGALPVILTRLDSIRSLPSDIMRRLLFNEERKRQRRLREKDCVSVRAEVVSVWSIKI
ncbi:hypothetical protein PT974_07957 [Cladobotryum mycophilum]|uniref:Uncharacterized protein n=1 Tax=Cladobotryum mycophilum TaxID=491253 RepID=A0ABR0SCY2_9HYPO